MLGLCWVHNVDVKTPPTTGDAAVARTTNVVVRQDGNVSVTTSQLHRFRLASTLVQCWKWWCCVLHCLQCMRQPNDGLTARVPEACSVWSAWPLPASSRELSHFITLTLLVFGEYHALSDRNVSLRSRTHSDLLWQMVTHMCIA